MRIRTVVRWTGGYWFLPILFAATCLVGSQGTVLTGYPVSDIATVSLGLYLAAPLTAAMTAFQFRGFPRFVRSIRSSRPGTVVVFGGWWGLLCGAPLVVCLAVAVTARAVPDDLASWSLLAIALLTVVACALLGLAFTWALPVAIAVPSVLVLCFLWIAYVPSNGDVLLQNMDPTFAACCSAQMQPASAAVLAALTLAILIAGAVALLLAPRNWACRPRAVLAPMVAGLIALGLAGGAAVATTASEHLTLQSVEPRTTSLVCQRPARLPVCLWPESREQAGELASIVRDLNLVLSGWRLERIEGLTQGGRDRAAVTVHADKFATSNDLRYTIAAGYVDHQTRCTGLTGRWRDERVGLIALAAGMSPESLSGRFHPEAVATATAEHARSRIASGTAPTWFADGLAEHRCEAGE